MPRLSVIELLALMPGDIVYGIWGTPNPDFNMHNAVEGVPRILYEAREATPFGEKKKDEWVYGEVRTGEFYTLTNGSACDTYFTTMEEAQAFVKEVEAGQHVHIAIAVESFHEEFDIFDEMHMGIDRGMGYYSPSFDFDCLGSYNDMIDALNERDRQEELAEREEQRRIDAKANRYKPKGVESRYGIVKIDFFAAMGGSGQKQHKRAGR